MEKELQKKEKELKIIKNLLEEELIISQLKSMEYEERQQQLEDEIKQLKENINKPKIRKEWIELEGGWRQRIYKNE